jgi:regulatory protein YycI of two-component signal transduction system YycFG
MEAIYIVIIILNYFNIFLALISFATQHKNDQTSAIDQNFG